MAKEIFWDPKRKEYTLKDKSADGSSNQTVVPAKYSPDDKYAKYRQIARDRENTTAPQ